MALADVRVVFIDDGGVLNDNDRRAPQWRRLLGEYFVPRLGGTPEAWALANVGAFERSWARYLEYLGGVGTRGGIERWIRADRGRWLTDMCDEVGVATPPDPIAAAVAAGTWVSERVRADIPGAIDAVRTLAARGVVMHTASGGLSWDLEPYLRAMGIRECFDRLYGPDLVDTHKNGPHYYAAILADADTDPESAAVVDDAETSRTWARAAGLRTYATLAQLLAAID